VIKLPPAGGLTLARELLAPASVIFEREFGGDAVRLLLAGNALHADIPLDGSGSGFLGVLLIMLGQSVGFRFLRVVRTSCRRRCGTASLRMGGAVVCNAEVTKIAVEHSRAVGVRVHDQLGDLPADSRTGPGYHTDPRALLGVRIGTPRRQRAWGLRHKRSPGCACRCAAHAAPNQCG
jgi:phytoene dehydrogenase-like protein